MTILTSGRGWISSTSTVTDSGTSTPASPASSANPLGAEVALATKSPKKCFNNFCFLLFIQSKVIIAVLQLSKMADDPFYTNMWNLLMGNTKCVIKSHLPFSLSCCSFSSFVQTCHALLSPSRAHTIKVSYIQIKQLIKLLFITTVFHEWYLYSCNRACISGDGGRRGINIHGESQEDSTSIEDPFAQTLI